MSVSARWAAGIACVEVRHDRPGRKRAYVRLTLDEAKALRDAIDEVIDERQPDDADDETSQERGA